MENTINTYASEKVVIKNLVVSGDAKKNEAGKRTHNGKINFKTPDLEIYNITAAEGCTAYNIFEGSQLPSDESTLNKKVYMHDCVFNCNTITHNILNVYTPAPNAEILIKDCSFDLNVANSNIMRVANYANSDNVKITFENVDWTYENVGTAENSADWKWAGLLLYQPASNDSVLTGDVNHLKTWTITFKNCKYNGTLLTEKNCEGHIQPFILYNRGNGSAVETISDLKEIENLNTIFNFD